MRSTPLQLASVLATLSALGCALPSEPDPDEPIDVTSSAIRGGWETPAGSAPAVGVVIWGGNWYCNASVVAPQILMVTATCMAAARDRGLPPLPDGFYDGPGRSVTAVPTLDRLGAAFGVRHIVDGLYFHPESEPRSGKPGRRFHANIALLRLSAPLVTTPLRLASSPATPTTARACHVIGYGRDSETEPGRFLRKRAALNGVSQWDDEDRWHAIKTVPRSPFTRAQNGDPASGDGGAPLSCDGRIFGIASFSESMDWGGAGPLPTVRGDHEDYDYFQPVTRPWVASVATAWRVAQPPR